MHVPLTREEVATFLEISVLSVERLWRNGELDRTVYHGTRCSSLLAHSSPYDVLEYALASGILPVMLSRSSSALWLANLAEADEIEGFSTLAWDEQVRYLVWMADEDGLAMITPYPEKTAAVIILSREAIVATTEANDHKAELLHEDCLEHE